MSALYDRVIDHAAAQIVAEMRRLPYSTNFAIWFSPRFGDGPGILTLGETKPADTTDIIRLGPHGTTVMRCPFADVRHHLHQACRQLPILPADDNWLPDNKI